MYFVVFSILKFFDQKLISEYSLEFGFVSWVLPLLFCPPITAACSVHAASAPGEVRAGVCALPSLRRRSPVLLTGPSLVLRFCSHLSSETGQPVCLGKELTCPELPGLPQSGLWQVLPSFASCWVPNSVWHMPERPSGNLPAVHLWGGKA